MACFYVWIDGSDMLWEILGWSASDLLIGVASVESPHQPRGLGSLQATVAAFQYYVGRKLAPAPTDDELLYAEMSTEGEKGMQKMLALLLRSMLVRLTCVRSTTMNALNKCLAAIICGWTVVLSLAAGETLAPTAQ